MRSVGGLSAFGIEHGEISKGLPSALRASHRHIPSLRGNEALTIPTQLNYGTARKLSAKAGKRGRPALGRQMRAVSRVNLETQPKKKRVLP